MILLTLAPGLYLRRVPAGDRCRAEDGHRRPCVLRAAAAGLCQRHLELVQRRAA